MPHKSTHSCNKRRSKSDWSKLPTDLLESILSKLSFINIIRFKAVCTSWLTTAESYVLSSSHTPLSPAPWLLVPPKLKQDNNSFRFFSLEDNRVYTLRNMPKEVCNGLCIGSSHGWLIFLEDRLNLCLFNPFSRARIPLPNLETFPHIKSVNLSQKPENTLFHKIEYRGERRASSMFESPKFIRNWFFAKAILSSDPSHGNNNVVVMVIYFLEDASQLAFCKPGDKKWTKLDTELTYYNDVICHNNHFYALRKQGTVEIWVFRDSFPIKTVKIEASWPLKSLATQQEYVSSIQSYIVEKSGDIMLVVRYFVDYDDPGSTDFHPVLDFWEQNDNGYFGKRTFLFHVYKLDLNQKKWVEVETLNDCALFLGGNHSMFISADHIPECKENSIHFTHDHWNKMKGKAAIHDVYDIGAFNLEDKTVKPYHHSDWLKIEPVPFWIVPNPG